MKNGKKLIFCVVLVTCLVGCSKSYQATNWFMNDGCSDIRIDDDVFIVTFKGNGFTRDDRVKKYALLRAAELARENGYNFFLVKEVRDLTGRSYHMAKEGTWDWELSETRCPGLELTVKCYKQKPAHLEVINVNNYIKSKRVSSD